MAMSTPIAMSIEDLKELGNQAFRQGQLNEAITKYKEALSKNDSSNKKVEASVCRNLSLVFYKLGQYFDAVDVANQAIQMDPQNQSGYIRKFMAQEQLGDLDAGIHSLQEGIKSCHESETQDLKNLLAKYQCNTNKRVKSVNVEEDSLLKSYIDRLEKLGLEDPVKITVLSGFLGAGKTTLLRRILYENHDYKMAVIVNDMAEINIDGSLVRETKGDDLIEMSNGCICCTLRQDLLEQVTQILEKQLFNYIVIESTGISEPMPVAATFESSDSSGRSLRKYVQIDAMVTVLDVSQFMKQLKLGQSLKEKQMEAYEGDERNVSDLIVDQLEFANIILLNKIDLLKNSQNIHEIQKIIQKLNRTATVLCTKFCDVHLHKIISVQRFDIMQASEAAGWFVELQNNHRPETEEYGISSIVFRNPRPFHPERLRDLVYNFLPNCGLRSKGFFWIASRPTIVYELSIAGASVNIIPYGEWTSYKLPADVKFKDVNTEWDSEWGDRINKIVVIGQNLEKDLVYNNIMNCLATKDEVEKMEMEWQQQIVESLRDDDQELTVDYNLTISSQI